MISRKFFLTAAVVILAPAALAAPQGVSTTRLGNGAVLAVKTDVHARQHKLDAPLYAPAGTDFDNFDTHYPNATFTPWEGYILCGAEQVDAYCNATATQMAIAFTTLPTGSQYSKGIDVALEVVDGSGGATLALYNDGGGVPGTALAGSSQHVSASTPFGTLGAIVQAPFPKRVTLANSTQYWVVVTPDSDSTVAWDDEDTDYTDTFLVASQSGAGGWANEEVNNFVPAVDAVK